MDYSSYKDAHKTCLSHSCNHLRYLVGDFNQRWQNMVGINGKYLILLMGHSTMKSSPWLQEHSAISIIRWCFLISIFNFLLYDFSFAFSIFSFLSCNEISVYPRTRECRVCSRSLFIAENVCGWEKLKINIPLSILVANILLSGLAYLL